MAPETLGMTPSASTTPKEPGQAFLFSAHDSPLRGVVAGVITGTAAVMIGHPFDTVKVRLQSGVKFSPAMFKHIYRGVTAPLSVVMPAWAANFFIYTNVLNRIGTDDISSCTMAGAMTGAIMTLMICPTEFLKCNAQSLTDSAGGKRLTDTQIFRRLVERNGLGSMYTGYAACILRDVGQNGMYFFLAELMNRELKSDGWLGPNLAPFAAGAITGARTKKKKRPTPEAPCPTPQTPIRKPLNLKCRARSATVGRNYVGHDNVGHDYVGHNYIGHNYVAQGTGHCTVKYLFD